MRKVSAKLPTQQTSSNNVVDQQATRSRESSVDPPQQRYGASAYIDQSEYDVYKQPTATATATKSDGANRGVYVTYAAEQQRNRPSYTQDPVDDDYETTNTPNEYTTFTKGASGTSYSGS